jgi:phospholipase/carboxylesterase
MDTVEIGPDEADAAIVWLHGLGADGHDFAPIVPELGLERVRYVFPHAPIRPITINGGMPMRAWYDVLSLSWDSAEDAAGIRESEGLLRGLIEREQARGLPFTRILVAGFSQGGVVALHTGLRFPQTLGGIVALSTYLPLRQTLAQEASPANRQTPIFMAHGAADQVIPVHYGEISRERLREQGYRVDWHDYPMGHAVCADQIRDLGAWLTAVLG